MLLCSVGRLCVRSVRCSFVCVFIRAVVLAFVCLLMCSSNLPLPSIIGSCGRWFVRSAVGPVLCSFPRVISCRCVRSGFRSFARSFLRSVGRSFVYTFIRAVVLAFVCLLMCSFNPLLPSMVGSCGRWFVRSVVHSVLSSFLRVIPRRCAQSGDRLFARSFLRSVGRSVVSLYVRSCGRSCVRSRILCVCSCMCSVVRAGVLPFVGSCGRCARAGVCSFTRLLVNSLHGRLFVRLSGNSCVRLCLGLVSGFFGTSGSLLALVCRTV